MLTRMVKVGDKVQDTNGDVWTITHIDGGIAYYDKMYRSETGKLVKDCFIAKFNTNGDGVITYNTNMTLVEA